MYCFNTTGSYRICSRGEPKMIQTLDRDYSYGDAKIKKVYTLKEYGLQEGFYGGNVHLVCELQDSPVILLVNTMRGYQLTDTAINTKDLERYLVALDYNALKNLVRVKNLESKVLSNSKENYVRAFCLDAGIKI